MHIISVTPVLIVEAIEPVIELWEGRLKLARVAAVEHEGRLGFVMYAGEGWTLMYQSQASVDADIGKESPQAREAVRRLRGSLQAVFIKVSDLAAIEAGLKGVPLVMARRTTFYGSTEIAIRDPAGHLVIFAQFKDG